MIKYDRRSAMFKSMDAEIMQVSILLDEILEKLGSEMIKEAFFWESRIKEAALPFLRISSTREIESFYQALLKLKDILDAEASVELWIVDDLKLGKIKGLIFENQQLPRPETSGVLKWWRQLRPAIETALDVLSPNEQGFHTFTNRHKQHQRPFSDYTVDVITGVLTRVRKILNACIIHKPPEYPKRIYAARDADNVVGRQDDLTRIVDLLVSHFEPTTALADVHVVPIVGDSGLGKTTLAKLVYEDQRVESHFNKKMWISYSNIDGAGLDVDLFKSLLDSRFLLVLDGVSNEICGIWCLLQVQLKKGVIGSRILVTTRSSLVSSTLGTIPCHDLQPLSFEDSWLLFTSNTPILSSPPPSQCYKDMVQWFQGFPSLVIALREFSRSKPNEKEVRSYYYSPSPYISSALLRTYHILPSLHIKKCLLYCALFPKGYRFQKHKLVWLWMAEGFLQSKGTMTMEEVGFSYFEELLQASFIECKFDDFTHHDSSSYIITELAQCLLQYMCGNEYLRIDNDDACFSEYTLHLSLCFERVGGLASLCCKGVSDHCFGFPPQSSSLHTLLLLGEYGLDDRYRFEQHIKKLTHNLPNFTRLRVLDISYTCLSEVPESICSLKHLRFLDISGSNFKCLPEKMSMLHNLQTLIIEGPDKVPLFPRDIGKLVCLRHLILGGGLKPFVMPPGVGMLTKLQTLPRFVVGHESDKYKSGSIEELKELKYLEGSLTLLKLENVSQEKAAQGSWLVDKAHLQELMFVWRTMHDPEIAENLLRSLEPHTNLKHLKVLGYVGRMFPTWMGCPSFSNLETIELDGCRKGESLPALGQLPSLKSLCISAMVNLKYIDDRFLGNHMDEAKERFKSLKILKFEGLPCLEKWSGLGEGDMVNLEELKISWCDMLISLPTLKFIHSLKRLTFSSCSKLEFPSEGLPHSLDSLVILYCPLLSERLDEKKEAGEFYDYGGVTIFDY